MFFRSRRSKATEAATASLRPLIAMAQVKQGMTLDSYRDPYILGFLFATASFFAELGNNKLTTEDLGFAIRDSFANVSSFNGAELVFEALNFAANREPDFDRGSNEASVLCFYSCDMLRDEERNPLVQEASKDVDFLMRLSPDPNADRRSVVAGEIMTNTFLRRESQLREQVSHA